VCIIKDGSGNIYLAAIILARNLKISLCKVMKPDGNSDLQKKI